MKRMELLASITAATVFAAAPALAEPGNGHGPGGINANVDTGAGIGAAARDMGRIQSQSAINANSRAMVRANENSAVRAGTGTDARVRGRFSNDSDGKITGSNIVRRNRMRGDAEVNGGVTAQGHARLTGVESGMTVVDSGGAAIGTVTGVVTRGNDSIRAVQVTLTDGRLIILSPKSLTLDGDVLTTANLDTNIKSQGAAHANINGLTNASPNSALAVAGVTSLTGLAADLTVNNSLGDPLGTVGTIFTNRAGAVVGINVDLTGGGTLFLPATTLSMDGTTVVTSSTSL